ncbi:MAG: putative baseplate assembly protein [Chloroflexaceae bacterium]|jgi:predicted phage baseplate assembly protein|nr:putative baseplate assembly protein [Chloroflexaceae bacterium]
MPLPTPQLDDRRFQDIVDQAKRLIPTYCPEWTDHNVSDPGVALIELFAWMTEMLLYRVNQVPEKMQIKFLELLGVQLEGPRAARAPVTFYLSSPQPAEIVIPADTEVATIRTETSPSLIFTTETALAIRPPNIKAVFTRSAANRWVPHNLAQLGLSLPRIPVFSPAPAVGDGFYIAFEADHSQHVLALVLRCEEAGGAGVRLSNPPIEWQVFQGGPSPWATCEVELDETGGFNKSGSVILHLPHMVQTELNGTAGFWLRCRLTEAQNDPDNSYRVSPDLEWIRAEARGGTVVSRHATSVMNEVLGRSSGSPGQRFQLLSTPLLSRDPERDYLLVERGDGVTERWSEVADFGDSGRDDPHYTLDNLDGTLTLGPMLLQPDGSVWHFGAVPPRDSLLRFSRYQHGGGVQGNLPRGAISVLKTSIPYVAQVVNRAVAEGGRDAQSLEDARLKVPRYLRTRNRAVTADDFEYLATQLTDVARACCLAPAAQPDNGSAPPPGRVTVVVLPRLDAVVGSIPLEQMQLSAELKMAVESDLSNRCLVGIRPEVRGPEFVSIAVQTRLRLPQRAAPTMRDEVRQRAEAALYAYLNPYTGGPGRDGWPFGRDLHVSEIYSLLQRVPGVEFVEDVQVTLVDVERNSRTPLNQPRLAIRNGGVVCSATHQVTVV